MFAYLLKKFALVYKSFYYFRYAKLVYEDLVKDPIQTLTDLYQKLELPIDIWSIKAAIR